MTPILNEKQYAILEFCKSGKSTKSIAEHLGCSRGNVYGNTSILKKMGLLKRIGAGSRGMFAVFVSADGDIPTPASQALAQSDFSELIKRAHDPFNLTGRVNSPSTTQLETSL